MVRFMCTARDSVLCARELLLLAVLSDKLHFKNPREVFYFACFAGCFRLDWSSMNKKFKPQPTKNTPQDEQTSYLLYYSYNALDGF